jgi:uroporphyrinogen-III decarboxylase
MTPRQRILAGLRGDPVDRIPWAPNLVYWWEMQDSSVTSKGEIAFLSSIGADPLIRGHYPMQGPGREQLFLFDLKFKRCEVQESERAGEKRVRYTTPVGDLDFLYKYSPAGNTWFLREHGVKTENDFKILAYLKEDSLVTPSFNRFKEAEKSAGDSALLVPLIVPEMKSAFQAMIEFWVGTEELVYALADYPETVESTLALMQDLSQKTVGISIESGAEVFISWEDTSTTNISPSLYTRYIRPEIDGWCDTIHSAGKIYLQHACGHLRALLPAIAESNIDGIESISPPPTGNIELWEAAEFLEPDKVLVGGIEPTKFLQLELEELDAYVRVLLDKMGDSRFVLANSDSCPPGVTQEKFRRVTEIVRMWK